MKPRIRKQSLYVLFPMFLVGLLLVAAFVYRAELSVFAWETWRIAPEYMLAQNPGNAELDLQVANYYFNVDDEGAYDLNRAESYYIEALRADPELERAWYQLARISFIKGQFATALYRINKQFELHGESVPQVYYVRGLINGFSGRFDKAAEDFEYYLANWYPESWHTHTDLGWAYFMQEKFEQSAQIAKKGLQFHPDNPWLLTMYGVSLMNMEEKTLARESLEHAYVESLKLTEEDWAKAYPGNDPTIRARSLSIMQERIKENLKLLEGE